MASPTGYVFLRFFLSGSCFCFLLLFSLEKGHALERREILESQHHTVQIISLLPDSSCKPSPKGANKKSSLKVVHRHGPCSQLSRNKGNAPTLTEMLSHDQARVSSMHLRLAFNSGKTSLQDSQVTLPAQSGRSLGSGNYIVTVGIGTPKRGLSLIFDTGSDLTWTQCQPCVGSCYQQQQPIFDPSKSTSYSNISCNSALCSQLNSATGSPPGCSASTCLYAIKYVDQSFTIGFFAQEKLTLTSSDVFNTFLFGCGENNQGLFVGVAGLLGLGRDKLSIVSQTAQKYGKFFSYCLPSMSSSTGHLTFGNNGVPSTVKFTPLSINSKNPSFYFIDIKAISVGGRQLSISPSVFSTTGTIIDSGTVITRLPPAAYSALRTAFRQGMTNYPLTQAVSIFDTCYDLSNYTTVNIPKIGFFFGGNLNVDIDVSGILIPATSNQFCLAFAGNKATSDSGIFGNFQQQTLEVVYDVAGGRLGFGSGGCA